MVTRCAIALLLMIACCSGVMATQNLNSASGYALMPDASIIPDGQWELSAAYVVPRGTSELSKIQGLFPCDGNGANIRVLHGIGPKVEAGIGWQNINKDAGDASAFTVAAKTNLIDKPDTGIAVSAGLAYRAWSTDMSVEAGGFTLDADLPNVLTLYAVLDKTWKVANGAWKASIGLAYDNYSSTSQDIGGIFVMPFGPVSGDGHIDSKSFLRPFIGLSATTGPWTILFDYKPKSEDGGFTYQDTFWSLAARRALTPDLTGTAGIMTWNIPYTESDPGFVIVGDSDLGFFLDLTWTK